MAGYNWSKGKSNNAVAAESNGIVPASQFAKFVKRFKAYRGCTAADVKKAFTRTEYHHTSKFFNSTDYFDLTDLVYLSNRQKLQEVIQRRKGTFKAELLKCESCGHIREAYTGYGAKFNKVCGKMLVEKKYESCGGQLAKYERF